MDRSKSKAKKGGGGKERGAKRSAKGKGGRGRSSSRPPKERVKSADEAKGPAASKAKGAGQTASRNRTAGDAKKRTPKAKRSKTPSKHRPPKHGGTTKTKAGAAGGGRGDKKSTATRGRGASAAKAKSRKRSDDRGKREKAKLESARRGTNERAKRPAGRQHKAAPAGGSTPRADDRKSKAKPAAAHKRKADKQKRAERPGKGKQADTASTTATVPSPPPPMPHACTPPPAPSSMPIAPPPPMYSGNIASDPFAQWNKSERDSSTDFDKVLEAAPLRAPAFEQEVTAEEIVAEPPLPVAVDNGDTRVSMTAVPPGARAESPDRTADDIPDEPLMRTALEPASMPAPPAEPMALASSRSTSLTVTTSEQQPAPAPYPALGTEDAYVPRQPAERADKKSSSSMTRERTESLVENESYFAPAEAPAYQETHVQLELKPAPPGTSGRSPTKRKRQTDTRDKSAAKGRGKGGKEKRKPPSPTAVQVEPTGHPAESTPPTATAKETPVKWVVFTALPQFRPAEIVDLARAVYRSQQPKKAAAHRLLVLAEADAKGRLPADEPAKWADIIHNALDTVPLAVETVREVLGALYEMGIIDYTESDSLTQELAGGGSSATFGQVAVAVQTVVDKRQRQPVVTVI